MDPEKYRCYLGYGTCTNYTKKENPQNYAYCNSDHHKGHPELLAEDVCPQCDKCTWTPKTPKTSSPTPSKAASETPKTPSPTPSKAASETPKAPSPTPSKAASETPKAPETPKNPSPTPSKAPETPKNPQSETPSPKTTTTGYYQTGTWCGPANGQITTKAACDAATIAWHKPMGKEANGDWHAGCFINDGTVSFSKPGSGNHNKASNNGYLCTQKPIDASAPYASKVFCASGDGMITTKEKCAEAAGRIGGYGSAVLDAGKEWHAGCLIHHGKVYFSPLTKDKGAHHKEVNDGYFCMTP